MLARNTGDLTDACPAIGIDKPVYHGDVQHAAAPPTFNATPGASPIKGWIGARSASIIKKGTPSLTLLGEVVSPRREGSRLLVGESMMPSK